MYKVKKVSSLNLTVIILMVIRSAQFASAGTQGAYINSAGYGKAVDNVSFFGSSTSSSSSVTQNPSASCSSPNLPKACPSSVYCSSSGSANYVWNISCYTTGGASADDPNLDFVNVNTAPCATYTVNSSAVFTDAKSGTITVDATGTSGTAIWLRGLEFFGTGVPDSLDTLLQNSALVWNVLLVGPFNLDHNHCTALTIPFTTETGHANLYFIADAVAKSSALGIVCPGNVTYNCGDAVVYPSPQVTGGCGNVSVTYDPPANLLPAGTTTVKATATDDAGNAVTCTFVAVKQSLGFDGFDSPIGGTGGTCDVPKLSVNRGSNIPVKFTTSCGGAPYFGGTPTLSIRKYNKTCTGSTAIGGGNFQIVANEWHFNWDTTGLDKAVYLLTATLQDSSTNSVVIQVK
jgi:hypothetical protein